MTIDIEDLTLKQIADLEEKLALARSRALEASKAEVKAKIAILLEKEGLTIGDLYPQARRGRLRGKGAAKYANPDNPSETWSGRGRKPNWLVTRLKKRGASLDDFAI